MATTESTSVSTTARSRASSAASAAGHRLRVDGRDVGDADGLALDAGFVQAAAHAVTGHGRGLHETARAGAGNELDDRSHVVGHPIARCGTCG